MTPSVLNLYAKHRGETAWIIGKGPSLLNIKQGDIGNGPVIALNQAIFNLRPLNLPNVLYSQQKDGCVTHDHLNPFEQAGPNHVCGQNSHMIQPIHPEILLVSEHESKNCFGNYSPRYMFDLPSDFGLIWNTMSAPTAVTIAIMMYVDEIVMVSHDGIAKGDFRRADKFRLIDTDPNPGGYTHAGNNAIEIAENAGVPIRFVTPV